MEGGVPAYRRPLAVPTPVLAARVRGGAARRAGRQRNDVHGARVVGKDGVAAVVVRSTGADVARCEAFLAVVRLRFVAVRVVLVRIVLVRVMIVWIVLVRVVVVWIVGVVVVWIVGVVRVWLVRVWLVRVSIARGELITGRGPIRGTLALRVVLALAIAR